MEPPPIAVHVTAEDIIGGTPLSGQKCAIARALHREYPERNWHVGPTWIQGALGYLGSNHTDVYDTPREARRFIRAFDANEAVAPFDFKLGVE